jgi:hypothetical protein
MKEGYSYHVWWREDSTGVQIVNLDRNDTCWILRVVVRYGPHPRLLILGTSAISERRFQDFQVNLCIGPTNPGQQNTTAGACAMCGPYAAMSEYAVRNSPAVRGRNYRIFGTARSVSHPSITAALPYLNEHGLDCSTTSLASFTNKPRTVSSNVSSSKIRLF